MKILIYGLSRTGTKLLGSNLIQYLRTVSEKVSVHYIQRPYDVTGPSIEEQLENCVRALDTSTGSSLVRIHYTEEILSSELLKQEYFDRIYLIKRRDTLDHILSRWLAINGKAWKDSLDQQDYISQLRRHPVTIPLDNLGRILSETKVLSRCVVPNALELSFEELIMIRDTEAFCNYVNLPTTPTFEFKPGTVEYGSNKQELIANYEQIKDFFNTFLKNE